ncbi:poly-gamma-glutamate system protein [Candidatus Marithrix sp. Canyon 246]|uniref:poly-gamma-glutamate system protein n=1 Tax=Candidatus Marithrix sp. Canyon 246 TaxID=1827136 RepID=UPI000849F1B1|nr:poly-gamma-glutamate system protein [Candidatus Marithrix sp. Canyon 246]
MKKIYWKLHELDWKVHLTVAIVALVGFFCVKHFKIYIPAPHYEEKLEAATLMKKGMDVIDNYRIKHISDDTDNSKAEMKSALIGIPFSPITSIISHREYKQITINPNWAAVMIDFYKQAGVKKGDTIAAGFSGSFPALNLAVLAAAEILQLNVIAINSVAASSYGANIPELSWPDMNRILNDKEIISSTSVAASLGGGQDIGRGIKNNGIEILKNIISRNKLDFIDTITEPDNLNKRMEIYYKYARNNDIKAYVNVGGGIMSVGGYRSKKVFKPGLNNIMSERPIRFDSVMVRFAKQSVPVIQIRHIRELCKTSNMPCELNEIPSPGEGVIFGSYEYNQFLVILVLIIICGLLLVLVKTEYAKIIFHSKKPRSSEPMI